MIAVATDTHGIFGRHIQDGVYQYAKARGGARWRDFVAVPVGRIWEADLRAYELEGLIVSMNTLELLRSVKQLGVATVNVSGAMARAGYASVIVDNGEVGREAGRYFVERGYRQFIYVSRNDRNAFAQMRGRGFAEVVDEAGGVVVWVGDYPRGQVRGAERATVSLTELLRGIAKPVAVMAMDDDVAAEVLGSAEAVGLGVPDHVAILGVNDEPSRHFGTTGISSIPQPLERIGFEAAEMLDQILDGRKLAEPVKMLPAGRVVTRASTDTRAINDVLVINALRFIRENACRGARAEDVAAAVPASKRSLQRRFAAAVGATIIEELTRVRVMNARKLLLTTAMGVAEISDASGFGDRSRFSAAFRAATGRTPTEYRRTMGR